LAPDGVKLILASKRLRVMGSGGFARLAAQPGAAMREI